MRHRMWRIALPLLLIAAVAVTGGLVMLLWNAVVPTLFAGVRSIDYLHAVGLLVLSRMLFGGLRGGRGWRRHGRSRRWQSMTEEERGRLRQSMSARWDKRESRT